MEDDTDSIIIKSGDFYASPNIGDDDGLQA
jgi:hypothetical protein